MASDVLNQHLHLIQSVLSQKEEAKPRSWTSRESSQGRAVMRGHEVASLPSRMGLLMGWSRERVSPFRAKFGLFGQIQTGLVCANTVNTGPMAPVLHAITFCTWFVRFTDEVPRRLSRSGSVTASYKSIRKVCSTRRRWERALPGPILGDGSSARVEVHSVSSLAGRALKGKTSECRMSRSVHGRVSSATKATKWPEGTSSFQPAQMAKKQTQQPKLLIWQLVNVRRNQHGIVSHR